MSPSLKSQKNNFAVRGIMLDSARLMEKHSYYFDLLPKFAKWGINTLWWHFIDDQGFGIKLDNHSELATDFAFSKNEVKKFISAAADLGIDVVPEVETLGHAGYLLRLPQYAHLADGDMTGFNAACPSHPQTLELMEEIIDEIAELFPSAWLHAGLDEVNFSGCERCKKRTRNKPDWWIYTEHVKAIHKIITQRGKRMVMWADHVEAEPAMLKELPKDIVMAHWQYWGPEKKKIKRSLDAGFDCVGAPSLNWFGTMGQSRKVDFDSTQAMAKCVAKLQNSKITKGKKSAKMLGMVNTFWIPGRVLRDTQIFPMAFTAEALVTGGKFDRAAFTQKFCREYFGLRTKSVNEKFWQSFELSLHMNDFNAMMLETTNNRIDALKFYQNENFAQHLQNTEDCLNALTDAAGKVKRNAEEFNALVLSVRATLDCLLNARTIGCVYDCCEKAERAGKNGADAKRVADELAPACDALADAAKRFDSLTKLVGAEWNRTRYPRDAKKHLADAATNQCGRNMLLGRIARGAMAIKQLSSDFQKAATACKRTGKLPGWG